MLIEDNLSNASNHTLSKESIMSLHQMDHVRNVSKKVCNYCQTHPTKKIVLELNIGHEQMINNTKVWNLVRMHGKNVACERCYYFVWLGSYVALNICVIYS